MDLQLAEKVALVTGSSSGLGFAIAATLAAEGCAVAINGRDHRRLTVAVQELRSKVSGEVEGFPADVSIVAEAEALVRRVHERFGRLDVLVCNAGGPPSTRFANTLEAQWQEALDLNLLSTVGLCRAAVPLLSARGSGRIICLTSVAAKEPLPGLILSTTARSGVLGFCKALADEVASDGITVNAVCPGYMRTERVQDLIAERAEHERRNPDEVLVELVGRIPMRRIGEPAELAATVAFLASHQAGYITGVAMQIDGGYIRSIT